MDSEREVSEGKLLIDAAKATGVKGIIWSGLVPVKKISSGKYTKVEHFNSKAQVTEYGRASGVPFVDVQAGLYAFNFLGNFPLLVKEPDGTFTLLWVVRPTTVMPTIDMENDYGCMSVGCLKCPCSPMDWMSTPRARTSAWRTRHVRFPKASIAGKKVVFKQITPEEAKQRFVSLGFPPAAATDVVEGYQFFDEFGYYGGNPSTSAKGLARPTHTFAEFVRSADWSTVLT
ncbi:hypothetical protein DFH08DRAFT_886891 [Mycena albidolilacea]|uniref:NmrA-like domain-containing protein n=1 Tax=Mycena albidolilacea TaxID=1033008 RepID=A0AAD7EHE9_9AGAR|nr:hypothetical protein DFH08DRAFT_886891 [Mycena albidolilacea]